MKKLYDKYKNSGFEIVGISVDKKAEKQRWKETIIQQQLVWTQYLDPDGNEAHQYSIHAFPMNFLVDKNGSIIAKNISPEQLELRLKELLDEKGF